MAVPLVPCVVVGVVCSVAVPMDGGPWRGGGVWWGASGPSRRLGPVGRVLLPPGAGPLPCGGASLSRWCCGCPRVLACRELAPLWPFGLRRPLAVSWLVSGRSFRFVSWFRSSSVVGRCFVFVSWLFGSVLRSVVLALPPLGLFVRLSSPRCPFRPLPLPLCRRATEKVLPRRLDRQ